MPKDMKAEDEQLFDIRVIDRHVRKGTLDGKHVADYLKSLPDSSNNVDYIDVSLEPVRPSEDLTPHLTSLTFTSAETGEE